MAIHWTKFVELVVSTTPAYTAGDALGAKSSFTSLPEHGVIMSVAVIDRDKESANLDIVLFDTDIGGTTDNAAFSPSDAELQTCLGAILVDTWKAFDTNSFGIVDNVGLPYWAPSGTIFFQCVERGTPTFTATDDIRIALGIVY